MGNDPQRLTFISMFWLLVKFGYLLWNCALPFRNNSPCMHYLNCLFTFTYAQLNNKKKTAACNNGIVCCCGDKPACIRKVVCMPWWWMIKIRERNYRTDIILLYRNRRGQQVINTQKSMHSRCGLQGQGHNSCAWNISSYNKGRVRSCKWSENVSSSRSSEFF